MSGVGIHTVCRSTSGNWANEMPGSQRVLSVHATKREAVLHGRQLAIAARTEHVIHNADGTVSSHSSYAQSGSSIRPMRDELEDDTQPTPDEPSAGALGGAEEEQEIADDEQPGATDFLKAAKEGAERLKKLEP